jgi:hypothetical protein
LVKTQFTSGTDHIVRQYSVFQRRIDFQGNAAKVTVYENIHVMSALIFWIGIFSLLVKKIKGGL